jgi:hypothetical protein
MARGRGAAVRERADHLVVFERVAELDLEMSARGAEGSQRIRRDLEAKDVPARRDRTAAGVDSEEKLAAQGAAPCRPTWA